MQPTDIFSEFHDTLKVNNFFQWDKYSGHEQVSVITGTWGIICICMVA
jgi:hypothetical protein